MDDVKRGEEIINAIYKAGLLALMAIGVKSPEYVDRFSEAFKQSLDHEFKLIGLVKEKEEIVPPVTNTQELPKKKDLSDSVDTLGLNEVILKKLKDEKVTNIEELRIAMQKGPLTDIKDVSEEEAKEITNKMVLWNS